MTRINCGIKPALLSNKHLLAEHREIKRIPNYVSKNYSKIDKRSIPTKFSLGNGHVKFFYNKLQYLLNRYTSIYDECILRGFNITNYSGAWENIPDDMMKNYTSTTEDATTVINRLKERDIEFYKNLVL